MNAVPRLLLLFLLALPALRAQCLLTPPRPAQEALFEINFRGRPDSFVALVTDPDTVSQIRRDLAAGIRRSIAGTIARVPACYNPQWQFSLEPWSIRFFDAAITTCDASPAAIQQAVLAGAVLAPGDQWCPLNSFVARELVRPFCLQNETNVVSAATFRRTDLALGGLATVLGTGFTSQTSPATVAPLPTQLGGVSAQIRDGFGRVQPLPLLFAGPNQVNLAIPNELSAGRASLLLRGQSGQTLALPIFLNQAAPALFTVQQRLPQGYLLVRRTDGSEETLPLVSGNATLQPIEFGAAQDQVYLVLFGTGFGGATAPAVQATIAGRSIPVLYAGPQGTLTGLDQLNLGPLPRGLRGAGAADLILLVPAGNTGVRPVSPVTLCFP